MAAQIHIRSIVIGLGLSFASNRYGALGISERTVTSDQYRTTYWTSEQGLPQNTVVCLLQSADGYLWVGTRYGLARFDGLRMTDYTADLGGQDPDELDVRALAEDSEHRLWIQTHAGLVCNQQGRFSQVRVEGVPFPGPLLKICTRTRGGLWLAYSGGVVEFARGQIGRTLAIGRELLPCSGTEAAVDDLLEDHQGQLWVRIRFHGGVCWSRYDAASDCVEPATNIIQRAICDINAICPGRSGKLWLGRRGQLLCWENGQLTEHSTVSVWGSSPVEEMTEDTAGNVWVRTAAAVQLHRFDPRRNAFTSFSPSTGLVYCYDIRCLRADREENVWVGSGSGGLYRLQPRRLVSLLTGSTLTDDEVYSVAPGADGRVWLSTSYGLVKHQNGQFTVYTNQAGLRPESLARVRPALEHSSGAVYVGVDFGGLQTLRADTFAPVPCLDLSGPDRRQINSLAEGAGGTLWMASQLGLVELRADGCRLWGRTNGLSDERTFGLALAPDGSVWVGTRSGGVNQFKDGCFRVFTTREGLLSNHAWPLRAEPDGTVWIGTPIGLNRIRGSQVRAVTMRQGLFDNLAYCLIEDRRGNLWAFGNRGIWRVNKAELDAVADGTAQRVYCVNYGEANGMVSAEGNGDQQPNAALLPNGELWFPTTRGVVILDPERLPENTVRPLVVVEEVLANEEPVFRDGACLPSKFARNQPHEPLRLAPGVQVLEIQYTANTFTEPEKTRFRYRLDGEDAHWHESDTRRLALYTKLHPGRYCFRVEACNPHGYWSAVATELPFELEPYFYQTWSFYGFCGLAAVAAIGGFHARRLRNLRREEHLRQTQLVLEERSRIAKDLHDDLGANLTGVALQLEIATRALDQPAVLKQRLQSAVQSIRTLIDAMRGVVWSLNPRCDTLESFCAYVCEYAENFLGAAGLRCRLDFPEEVPAHMLSAEARHHLLLAIKESLNNVARHADATEVRLCLRVRQRDLTLTVADDGRGFAPESPAPVQGPENPARPAGTGLANMRRRVESLGGTFNLSSSISKGTTITIEVPLPPAS